MFEGATGAALIGLCRLRQSWSQIRYWLLDLATEISVAEKDGTLPNVLALDRVWITADGRAKLLDFPAPGWTSTPLAGLSPDTLKHELPPAPTRVGDYDTTAPPIANRDARQFLTQVAQAALEGGKTVGRNQPLPAPLPLHARTFLESLPTLPNTDAIAAALRPLLQRVVTVSRLRRAGLIAGCIVFPLFAALSMIAGMRIYAKWQRNRPEIAELAQVLNYRTTMNLPWLRKTPHPEDRTFAFTSPAITARRSRTRMPGPPSTPSRRLRERIAALPKKASPIIRTQQKKK